MTRSVILLAVVLIALLGAIPGTAAAQEGPSDTPLGFGEMWEDFYVFITITILFVGALGLMARSMTLASFGAFAVFVHLATGTGDQLLENILYVALVLIFIGMAFKLWRLEGGGA